MGPVQIADVATPSRAGAVTEVPFTIDTNEVRGGAYFSGGSLGFNWYQLKGQTSGILRLEGINESFITKVTLLTSDGDIIAQDLIIFGVKTTLIFNKSSAKQGFR